MDSNIIPFRFIRKDSIVYIRKEDIIKYLSEMAATEETDVRTRIEEAIGNISKLGDNNG